MPRSFPAARRKTLWGNVLPRISVDGLTAAANTGISTGAISGGGNTLVRCRGNGQYRFRPAAANDVHLVGLGLIVVSLDAFNIGATALPSPIDDVDSEWIWHQIFQPAVAFAAYSATDFQEYVQNFMIDSKAMRVLHPDDVIAFIADGLQLSGSPVSDIAAGVRLLVKLG